MAFGRHHDDGCRIIRSIHPLLLHLRQLGRVINKSSASAARFDSTITHRPPLSLPFVFFSLSPSSCAQAFRLSFSPQLPDGQTQSQATGDHPGRE